MMKWKKTQINKNKDAFGSLEMSDFYAYFANISQIFIEDYGFKKSVEKSLPIDKDGNPLPLYSYPAIEYLKSLDFENKEVFEFGSGNSSLFWLEKGVKLTSVENNLKWFEFLDEKTKDNINHKLIYAKDAEEYINSIKQEDKKYDVIIIDGSINRLKCCQNAINYVKEDGIMIIDNSDWFKNSTKFVRENSDFLQIDFYGFRPSKPDCSVTSLFFSRKANLKTIQDKQPSFAIGGIKKHSGNDLD